jgi:23S rRNA (cytosine1962-C5)-methyltransferase
MASETATATVNARGAARIRGGHPWVYRPDVVRGPAKDAGGGGPAIVEVKDPRGKPLGFATWAATARLALRMLTRGPETKPGDLLTLVAERFDAALARRRALPLARDAYRVVHAESDQLPGLVVDRYADAAVVQTTSVAMNAHRDAIAALVRERLEARVVLARDDGSSRDFEGLPRFAGIVAGPKDASTRVEYRLGPNRLEADLLTDSKTGGFLDQVDNHAAVAALAPDNARALDAFTYHGGFALALARRGGPVLATDEDETAVARAGDNARRNGLANLEVRRANAFDLLRELEARAEKFDVVVLDPPALAKRGAPSGAGAAAALGAADRAYKELLLRGARLTRAGGLLVACSCSGRVSRAHWDELVAEGLADAGRAGQILARLGAAADHPELAGVPETGHLKTWLVRVL